MQIRIKTTIYPTITIIFILFFNSCDKEISITGTEPAPEMGKIILNTDPEGAEIFINGDNTGKITPDSIVHIEPGLYRTKLRLSPYLDIDDSVIVNETVPVSMFTSFFEDSRNFGRIVCLSDPLGASIFINDSATGLNTPADLEPLWPGAYKITCSFPEHRDNSKYVYINGGESEVTQITLQDTSLCVDYNYYVSDYPATHTSCVEMDNNGVIWVGNYPGGLVKIENGLWEFINVSNSPLHDNSITCLAIDTENNKWIGTSTGAVRIDANDNWTFFIDETAPNRLDYIMTIACDNSGNTWIASTNFQSRRKLFKVTGDQWEEWNFPGNRVIVSLTFDNENRLWAGLDQGVLILENGEWSLPPGNYDEADFRVKTFSIESIKYDPRGYIWIATSAPLGGAGELFMFDGFNYNLFEVPEKYFSHIHIADNNNIWISCHGKYPRAPVTEYTPVLMKIDPEFNVTGYSFNSIKIPSFALKYSSSDNEGNLWIASRDRGLIKFKGANL
ncbi:PEGA domain-containing protein [Bacteroidota bacterium]